MKKERLQLEKRNGNYHIKIVGDFNPKTAQTLSSLICSEYAGDGNIFINTSLISKISNDSHQTFSKYLYESKLPANKIYYKGEKAYSMYHEYGRVIHSSTKPKQASCGGRCKKCKCKT